MVALEHMGKESAWEGQHSFHLPSWVNFLWRNSWNTEQKVCVLLKSRLFTLSGNVRDIESASSFYRGGAYVLQDLRVRDVQGWDWTLHLLMLSSVLPLLCLISGLSNCHRLGRENGYIFFFKKNCFHSTPSQGSCLLYLI